MNSGSAAFAVLLILLAVSQDSPIVYLSVIVAVMFLVQAVSLFVVFFCTKRNMQLWGAVLTCKFDEMDASFSQLSSRGGEVSTGSTQAATATTSSLSVVEL
jgi:hypothetical protein